MKSRANSLLGWRIITIALCSAVATHLVARHSALPGFDAALFAVAIPLAIAGWAAHMATPGEVTLRRDFFLGVSAGVFVSALGRLLAGC